MLLLARHLRIQFLACLAQVGKLVLNLAAPGLSFFAGRFGGLQLLAKLAFISGLIAGLSFLVAFPLWYFSSRSRPAFTLIVGGLLAAGLLYLPVRGLRRASRRAGGFGVLWRGRILPALRTTALVLAGLAAAYGIALLAARAFR